MVSPYMFQRVRELVGAGKSNSEISRELAINRKTVAKYRASNSPPEYKRRSLSTKVDPFEAYRHEVSRLQNLCPGLTGSEIFERLVQLGYRGSERTVHRKLQAIGAKKPKERFFQQVYEAGEQSQFDFKERIQIPFVGGTKICHLHFGTLPHSGIFWIKAFPNRTYESFMDGCHTFFERIGGMTEKIRFDNLAPVVKKVLAGDRRIYTLAFQRALNHYGFKPLPCRPGKGSDKGDVEREIRTNASRIENLVKVEGHIFSDYDALNLWLKGYCEARHSDQAISKFRAEQVTLKPLPRRDDDVISHVAFGTVTPWGSLRIDRLKASYSVPDEAIGAQCRLVVSAFDVRIFRADHDGDLITTHDRLEEGQSSIKLEHVIRSLVRKPGAMVRWAHKDTLFPNKSFRDFYSYLKGIAEFPEREFLKSVNLIQYATLSEIGVAMDLVMESGTTDPFEEVKKLVVNNGHNPSTAIADQRPLAPDLKQYDQLIFAKDAAS